MEELLGNIGIEPEMIGQLAVSWSLNIVAALLIFVIGRWISGKIANAVVGAAERASVDATLSRFLRSVIYMALLVMVIMAAVNQLGVDTTSFFAVLATAGLAVGLALKDSLSNFSAGVMLVFFRPFRTGDYVEAAGVAGTVETIRIFNTILKTPDNRIVTVPNSQIYGGTITNFSAEATRRIDLVFGVSYDDNVVKAKEIMQSILDADERILKDPAPVVMMLELADSSVNFAVRPWVKKEDYWAVRADVLEWTKKALEDNGLSIPYPQQDVYMHQAANASG